MLDRQRNTMKGRRERKGRMGEKGRQIFETRRLQTN